LPTHTRADNKETQPRNTARRPFPALGRGLSQGDQQPAIPAGELGPSPTPGRTKEATPGSPVSRSAWLIRPRRFF